MHSCCGQPRPGASARPVTASEEEAEALFGLISSTVVRVQLNFTLSTACNALRRRKRKKRREKERESGRGDMRQATSVGGGLIIYMEIA